MSSTETRQTLRDSLFLFANLRLAGNDKVLRAKVRNLSAGGMMAESDIRVTRGAQISIELRNIGWIEGVVAWTQDNRFGIAFKNAISADLVRSLDAGPRSRSEEVRRFSPIGRIEPDPGKLRTL